VVNGVIVQTLVNSFKEAAQEQALVEAREAGDKSDLRANSKRKSTHLRSDSGSEDESTDNSSKSSDKGIYTMHFELCEDPVVRTQEGKNIEERVTQITPLKRAMEKALLIDAVGRNFVLDVTSYLDGMWSQSLKLAGQLKAGYEQAGGLDQLTTLSVIQLANLTMLLKFHWSTTFEFGECRNWLTLDAFERKGAPICRKVDGLDTDGNNSGVAEALCAVQLTLGVFISAEFLGCLAAFIATLRGGARGFQHVKADHLLLRVHGGLLAEIMGCIRSCPDFQGLPLQTPAQCATAVTHGFG
jgi:hypothetical protein